MKKLLLPICLSSALYATTLTDLIHIALENNKSIQQSEIKLDDKKQNIKESTSSYLPTLSLSADATTHEIESGSGKSNGESSSISLNANQLIYDFGKTINQIKASKKSFEATQKELISTTNNVVLNVKKTYYDILNKQRLVDIALESIKIDEVQLYQAKEYFKAKIKTKIDLTDAQFQLSNSKLELLKAQYNLKKANANLITIVGETNTFDIEETLDINNIINLIESKNYNLEELLNNALKNRAEIKMYKDLIRAATLSYQSGKDTNYPTLNLTASYKDTQSKDIVSLESTQSNLGIYLKWELFSGFRTEAKTQLLLNTLRNTKEQLKEQELTIKENVSIAYYDVKQNIDSVKLSQFNLKLAQQKLHLAQERYKNGLNDLVELNDSKLDFITAKNNLINQYYGYKVAQAVLDYEIGVIY